MALRARSAPARWLLPLTSMMLSVAASGCGDGDSTSTASGGAGNGGTTSTGGSQGGGGTGGTSGGGTGGTAGTSGTGGTSGSGGTGTGASGGTGTGGTGASGGTGGTGGSGGSTSTGCDIIRVNGATGNDMFDGSAWFLAKATVGAALQAAAGTTCTIWVAKGTYKPTTTVDRTISFQLQPGVAIYGGFAGNEGSLDERDIAANETILSGDIGAAGVHTDNSHHVVRGAHLATIDGFTITGGFTEGAADRGGGGLHNLNADLTVGNCTFRENRTGDGLANEGFTIGGEGGGGGGLYQKGGKLTVTGSTFELNVTGAGGSGKAIGGPGGYGAGLAFNNGVSLQVTGTVFKNNTTGPGGPGAEDATAVGGLGGMGAGMAFVSDGELTVTDCMFEQNTTGAGGFGKKLGGGGGYGGGLAVNGVATTTMKVDAALFKGNKTGPGGPAAVGAGAVNTSGGTGGTGGGLFQAYGVATISNSTFEQNTTGDGDVGTQLSGGGGMGGGLVSAYAKSVRIEHTQVKNNTTGKGSDGPNVAGGGGPGAGAAISNDTDGTVLFDVNFESNITGPGGQGILNGGQGAGGGLTRFNAPGPFAVASCTFRNNQAGESGGLNVFLQQGTGNSVVLVDNVFWGNVATQSVAGGAYIKSDGTSSVLVANNTFANNSSFNVGGGLYYGSFDKMGMQPHRFVNNVFWANNAGLYPNLGHQLNPFIMPAVVTVDHNDIGGGCIQPMNPQFSCGTNLDVDPMFVDMVAGNLALSPGSPVANQGDTAALPADVADLDGDGDTMEPTPLDRAGAARVTGAAVDMGAYELP